jgi:hypothetical protein
MFISRLVTLHQLGPVKHSIWDTHTFGRAENPDVTMRLYFLVKQGKEIKYRISYNSAIE